MAQTLIEKYQLQKYVNAPVAVLSSGEVKSLTDILADEMLGVEKNAKEKLVTNTLQTIYPIIDLSFLNMKHPAIINSNFQNKFQRYDFKTVLPRFGIYSLNSPKCVVALTVKAGYKIGGGSGIDCYERSIKKPKLPKELVKHLIAGISITGNKTIYYESVYLPNSCELTFSSQFFGLIPQNVKDKIQIARKAFGEDLYLVAEAHNWETGKARLIHNSRDDPLIIGVKGRKSFLIAEFDCTPLEDYVRREFTE